MLLFKFEDVLLTALGQQPGNTIWTYEQLSAAIHSDRDKVADLALSGDILGVNEDAFSIVDLWNELFGLAPGSHFRGKGRFTEDKELVAVLREARRIVCQSYPWLADNGALLREVIASSLSFAFLVWIQREDQFLHDPDYRAEPTLYQHLCAQNLAA
jgi:hypothetical protein